jgi:NTP pyrophosphatase (non-canonical NTP hydrolase)
MSFNPDDFLDFDTYQYEASRFVKPAISDNIAYFGLGLSGETGEVNELIKKSIRDETVLDTVKLTSELSDVLWYVSQVAQCAGIEFSSIVAVNLNKLTSRMERGVIGGSGDNR